MPLLKEERQLEIFRKQKARPKSKAYLWYMVLILTLIYIVDEVATNLPNSLETELNIFYYVWPNKGQFTLASINDVIFNMNKSNSLFDAISDIAEKGLGKIGTIKTIANATLLFSMFYRPLADRYGRRIFLFINTLGMAAALFVIYTASSLIGYAIGFFMLRFFVTPDQQVVYLYEIAPEKSRGALLSITKGVAELGLVFIWLLRKLFLNQEEIRSFRIIFLVIAIAAFVVAFIALLFSRESDVFLDERIAYLELSDEEKQKLKESKDASKAQGGFIKSLIYSFKDKQILWIMIATAVIEIGYSCCNNYSNVLSTGVFGNNLNQTQATDALFFFPFTCALVTLIHGFVSDRIGRKKTGIILLSTATLGFILEFISLYYKWPTWTTGLFLGIVLGADWAIGDVLALMAGESCTTNMRSSIMSAWSTFFGIGMITSMILTSIVPSLFGLENLSLCYFFIAVPAWIIGLCILTIKVKETSGTDLASIGKDK